MNRKIFVSYINTPTYSGQSAASTLLIQLLSVRGWECKVIPLYPFIRGKSSKIVAVLRFIRQQFITMQSVVALMLSRRAFLYINLGQSMASFFRVAIWFLPYRLIHRRSAVVISLHGNVFMSWPEESRIKKVFLYLLKKASAVTVLGKNQQQKLVDSGLEKNKVFIVPNTFDLKEDDIPLFDKKFLSGPPVQILHLSLLIESKGFPEYLQALQWIAVNRKDISIRAVLCGPVSFTGYCTRFKNAVDKTEWIVKIITEINLSENVCVQWIKGAGGNDKRKLFQDAEIFVFPSRFPVEAQPLVLLEAMASGCAIITSNAGEISSTVDKSCAIILDEVSIETVAVGIIDLCTDNVKRKMMGQHGYEKVNTHFSSDVYINNWMNILQSIDTA